MFKVTGTPPWYRDMCKRWSRAVWRGEVTELEATLMLRIWHGVALDQVLGWAGIEVTLTPEQVEWALAVGARRQERRSRAGHRNAYGSMDEGEDHLLGAMGECAFSVLSGLTWTGAQQDIGADNDVSGVQVRTRREHDYDLYLWPKDMRNAWWVLMTGTGPTFVYRGRIWGQRACARKNFRKAKRSGFPRADCFVVPRGELERRGATGIVRSTH